MPDLDLHALDKDFLSQGKTIIDKLHEWAECKGDSPCLYYGEGDRLLSYREFDRLCNQIANGFAETGVAKGGRVSVLSTNHLVTTLAMFACWKLGAVYCPINTRYKRHLLTYILNDTAPGLLVLDRQFVDELNHIKQQIQHLPAVVLHQPKVGEHDYCSQPVGNLDRDFTVTLLESFYGHSDQLPAVTVTETDLANIVYTSGTTGNPKGVVHNHRWMHNYIHTSLKLHHPDDVLYSDLPMYHVGGACFNVVRAVWAGCKLALWDRFSPNSFWERIRNSGATHAVLMDVMIDWLMKAPPSDRDREHSLKYAAMNPLPANHNEVARRFGIDFIGAGYGSTELGAGFGALIDELGDEFVKAPEWQKGYTREAMRELFVEAGSPKALINGQQPLRKGIMGVPVPLVEVKVVDENDKSVPPGVPGQAAFRHRLPDMLFREYFNKPEATREAVRDGWYYPSDLISYDENGLYYFEDRKQGFIRVRGENLSAVTVEHQLQKHPAVHRSAVVGVPAAEGNEQDIAAFIVLKNGGDLTEATLHAWAEANLPKFMRPRYFRFLEELPVTPTFKVEKYKLKERLLAELAGSAR